MPRQMQMGMSNKGVNLNSNTTSTEGGYLNNTNSTYKTYNEYIKSKNVRLHLIIYNIYYFS